MNFLDAFWHFGNLFLPAWVVAALMAVSVKALWREASNGLTWRQLTLWGGIGGSMGTLAALLLLGRDGSMIGYGLMLVGVTLPQWGLSFRR